MASEREILVALIRETLESGPPRSAREIAAAIRSRPGFADVHRRDVNSILYGELSRGTWHDEEYRWSSQPRHQWRNMVTTKGVLPATERAEPLRVISRLRSGLPPQERILDLTIRSEGLVARIQTVLHGASNGRRALQVTGDYGDGKSHTLALIADMARSAGLATCHLSADGAGAALNHPQRFLPILLASLEVPGRTRNGYEDLLYQVLLSPEESRVLGQITGRLLNTARRVDGAATYALRRMTSLRAAGEGSTEELNRLARLVAYHLTGESICHRPANPSTRELAYRLLRVAGELLKSLGTPGLVIVIDEAESIFTKLPTTQSRRGAYRVLAALCAATELESSRVAFAMTPDALRALGAAVPEMFADTICLACEPVKQLAGMVAAGSFARIVCAPPRAQHRADLLERIRSLYSQAYPDAPAQPGAKSWEDLVRAAVVGDWSVRLLVRQAIDHLDRRRYSKHN